MTLILAFFILMAPVMALDRVALVVGGNCEEKNFANNLLKPMADSVNLLKKYGWDLHLQYAGREARCVEAANSSLCQKTPSDPRCCPVSFDPKFERRVKLWSVETLEKITGISSSEIFESTVENLYRFIEELNQSPTFAGKNKQFLLVVVTHGSEKEGNQYICMADRRMKFPEPRLVELLESLNKKGVKTGVINRTCYSGASLASFGPKTCALGLTSGNLEGYLLGDDDPIPALKWLQETNAHRTIFSGDPLNLDSLFITSASKSGSSTFNYVSNFNYPSISTDPIGSKILESAAGKMLPFLADFYRSVTEGKGPVSLLPTFGPLLRELLETNKGEAQKLIDGLWDLRRSTHEEEIGIRIKKTVPLSELMLLSELDAGVSRESQMRLLPLSRREGELLQSIATWEVNSHEVRLQGDLAFLDTLDGPLIMKIIELVRSQNFKGLSVLESPSGSLRLVPIKEVSRANGGFEVVSPREDTIEREMKDAALWMSVPKARDALMDPLKVILEHVDYQASLAQKFPGWPLNNILRKVAKALEEELRRKEVMAWTKLSPEMKEKIRSDHHELLENWRERDLALHHLIEIPLNQYFVQARLHYYFERSPKDRTCQDFLIE